MNDGTVLQVLLVARGSVYSCNAITGGVNLLDEWSSGGSDTQSFRSTGHGLMALWRWEESVPCRVSGTKSTNT